MHVILLLVVLNFFIPWCFAKETNVTNSNVIYEALLDAAEKEDWRMVSLDESKDNKNIYQSYFLKTKQQYLLFRDQKSQLHGVNLVLSSNGDKAAFWINENYKRFILYTVNADGTGQTQILKVDNGGCIAWSPDGKKIAFLSDLIGKFQEEGSLYVVDVDTKVVRKILTNGVDSLSYQAWSPAGDKIVYGYQGKMFIFDLKQKKKVSLGEGGGPSWSPVENKILYYHPDKKTLNVITVNDAGEVESEDQLVYSDRLEKGGEITGPIFWFPNGKFILFGHLSPSDTEVGFPYLLKLETKETEKLSAYTWIFSTWARP